jgi:hypothetical protein
MENAVGRVEGRRVIQSWMGKSGLPERSFRQKLNRTGFGIPETSENLFWLASWVASGQVFHQSVPSFICV